MERKLIWQLRSFQKLLLREGKVDSALKIFVILRETILLSPFLFMFLEL